MMHILMESDSRRDRVIVDSLPRVGEYITLWSDNQTDHDIYEVVAVVHFASHSNGNPLLPSVLCEKRADHVADCVAWVRNHTEVR